MTKPKALISTNHGFGQMERRRTFSAWDRPIKSPR
jgi:hypothetical protein